METKTCKDCGRELALSEFRLTRGGARCSVCNGRANDKRAQTRYERLQTGGGKTPPFSDADFDGKQPVEVIQLMSRAKRWLEARGYSITLKGTYTQVKEVKF